MIRKTLIAGTSAAFAMALVGLAGSAALAAGGPPATHPGPKAPPTATGVTTCNFHGVLVTDSSGNIHIRGNMTPHHVPACSSKGGTKLRTGHLSGLASSTSVTGGLCALLPGASLPDVSGGTIKWSPRVASSTGVALTGGSTSVATIGSNTYLQVAYTGGSVAGGSFANASGASLTVHSRQTIAALTAACAAGPVTAIALDGSNLTL